MGGAGRRRWESEEERGYGACVGLMAVVVAVKRRRVDAVLRPFINSVSHPSRHTEPHVAVQLGPLASFVSVRRFWFDVILEGLSVSTLTVLFQESSARPGREHSAQSRALAAITNIVSALKAHQSVVIDLDDRGGRKRKVDSLGATLSEGTVCFTFEFRPETA